MANRVYLSLGSNVGDREENLRQAISRLGSLGRVGAASSFYETEPIEVTNQDWFVNAAVGLETELSPEQLITEILRIESEMGRLRRVNKGPRIIDIDILLYGDTVVNTPELTIPHPAMAQRRFVLQPLAEIAAEVRHPVLGKSIRELLKELPAGQTVRKFSASPLRG